MEFVWDTGKRSWQSTSFVRFVTLYQGILHSTNQSATGGVPVQVSAGQTVAGGEERIGSTTTTPMSGGRPSIFLPAEIPLNSVVGQQRLQISELQFDKFTSPSSFMH